MSDARERASGGSQYCRERGHGVRGEECSGRHQRAEHGLVRARARVRVRVRVRIRVLGDAWNLAVFFGLGLGSGLALGVRG